MRARNLLVSLALFLFATTASAEMVGPWIFRGVMQGSPVVQKIRTAQITEQGLYIQTVENGFIVWTGEEVLPGPAEVVTIVARAASPVEAALVWQPTDGSTTGLLELPFNIEVADIAQPIDVLVSNFPEWDWKTKQFGLAFPAGSEVLIEEIQFRHWTFGERMMERLKSFWQTDEFRPYSINFLWGPLIASNEPARTGMYEPQPPFAWSVTRYFYVIIGIAAAVGFIAFLIKGNRSLGIGIVVAVFAALWMLFDVRMGYEIIHYAVDDIRSYVLEEPADKKLRTLDRLHWVFEESREEIQKEETYGLFVPNSTQFYANARYQLYPSVPVTDTAKMDDVKLWLVLERPDVQVINNHLMLADTVLSGTGEVIRAFSTYTYLFREL